MTGVSGMLSGRRHRQRGVVLFISLVLLLVLTLIGLAATRSTTQGERQAANRRDRDLAFQAAEAALRDGEGLLQSASPGEFDNTAGYYDSRATVTWQTADWTGTGSNTTLKTIAAGTLDPGLAYPPRFYLVKTVQTAADATSDPGVVYEIVAKGWGTAANNSVVLESTFEVSSAGSGSRLSWRQLQ